MKAKKLDISPTIWRDFNPDSDRNGVETQTKNTIASASKGMRSLYAPRSARGDQGAHELGRIDDGPCEPNFDPKIFSLSEIN